MSLRLCCGAFMALVVASAAGPARSVPWTQRSLASFNGSDGADPTSSLIFDAMGNLYGTTSQGGTSTACNALGVTGCGTVFELTPPAPGKTAWTESVLVSFDLTDGFYPTGSLVFDAEGNLYGTASGGTISQTCGPGGCGIVFELTPPAQGQTAWTESIVFSFDFTDGTGPVGGVIFDRSGNLYGATEAGGKYQAGTIFRLTPPAQGKTGWQETVLYSFKGFPLSPDSGLTADAAGNYYGTTAYGGKHGYGTVYRVSPPAPGKTAWKQATLASFQIGNNKSLSPYGGVTFDTAGNLYGTTIYGGRWTKKCPDPGCGTVFKLTPRPGGKTPWTQQVIASFNFNNGEIPRGGVLFDAAGNLYGTTTSGGKCSEYNACGTAFMLSPPAPRQATWNTVTLAYFKAHGVHGGGPAGSLIFDAAGNLYGTTTQGGTDGDGTVFELSPKTKR
jgi:uncharacterized repeat protein (TIGR03803 family)